ncbi:GLPGLI family protein [Flavobacterium sp. LC2016-12]|uniref:GLPGLI family protein n=1 Tax=Flavobacterium sp. LC2016-12 TaxID=2783794 RepID=UPI00188BCC9D|nr:GLPGLI family protein [Flavobacterium sp. LC2016-12]MBF4466836.1 GLPGLI family protein [Flavobacterium sp. LC2016-12]
MKLFLFLLMLTASIHSQSSGTVRYRFYLPLTVDDIKKEDTKNFITKLNDLANNQEFELTFNKSKSTFKYVDKLNYDSEYDRKLNNVAKLAYTSSDTYIDLGNKTEVEIMDDGTLIKSPIQSDKWEIKNDTKKIGTYLCYKAVTQRTFVNKKGEHKTREIICWFAPALPYSYGPKTFYSLPGLILELTEDNKTFVASKIELFDKEIDINIPKGKMISREEYDKKLKEGLGAVIKSKS